MAIGKKFKSLVELLRAPEEPSSPWRPLGAPYPLLLNFDPVAVGILASPGLIAIWHLGVRPQCRANSIYRLIPAQWRRLPCLGPLSNGQYRRCHQVFDRATKTYLTSGPRCWRTRYSLGHQTRQLSVTTQNIGIKPAELRGTNTPSHLL